MRDIRCDEISETIAQLCIEANYYLGDDVIEALRVARDDEVSPVGQEVLDRLLENAAVAREEGMPLCQDTGLTVVFLDLGQDTHVIGGDLYEAVQEGVRRGYREGYLRKSIVDRPFSTRINTNDNTPAVIHCQIVPGDSLKITVVPKGGGSENMSALAMLKPADGRQGVVDFVVKTVEEAGANPCPPTIVGVGVGGTTEKAMWMAKHSLLREVGQPSPDPEAAELERDIVKRVNRLGIGPQGLGGRTTALAVHVETHPCHIASLPVGVNIQCHSARHKQATL
ncbi:MAG: fumarate hydratase [Anaerolineae bacterium]|nr:fumarate hydratase [Anaerolineae bacterium]NIN96079.1 fumarate hydratase [Anaerolineae bacterium]NIQ79109.1 fumarate hydratase [Anaerolineae bacterium]